MTFVALIILGLAAIVFGFVAGLLLLGAVSEYLDKA